MAVDFDGIWTVTYRLADASVQALDDLAAVERALAGATGAAGLHVLAAARHRFTPRGLSVALVLAESHLAIHTWPESAGAYATLTSCAPLDQGTVDAVGRALADALGAGTVRSVVATL